MDPTNYTNSAYTLPVIKNKLLIPKHVLNFKTNRNLMYKYYLSGNTEPCSCCGGTLDKVVRSHCCGR